MMIDLSLVNNQEFNVFLLLLPIFGRDFLMFGFSGVVFI
ncbi:hypothetical protein UF75_4006 [Desulfosporosinus sp. I2]|nr:hypothetical protein UF75_4006 [Desulfosporosinus sp. I2]